MTASTTSANKAKTILKKAMAILFWMAVWQICALFIGNKTVLPSPIEVLSRLGELIILPQFWGITGISCLRIIGGFLLGCLIGAVCGLISHASGIARYLLEPILVIIKTTPVASFIILVFIWLNSNAIPTFISVLIVVPVVSANVFEGFRSVDPSLIEAADVYRLRGFTRFRALYLPTVKSYFLAAFSTSLGFAFKAGIAAEILCTPRSAIGSEIYNGKIYLETENVFAWTIVVIILSLLFEVLFVKLLQRGAKSD